MLLSAAFVLLCWTRKGTFWPHFSSAERESNGGGGGEALKRKASGEARASNGSICFQCPLINRLQGEWQAFIPFGFPTVAKGRGAGVQGGLAGASRGPDLVFHLQGSK